MRYSRLLRTALVIVIIAVLGFYIRIDYYVIRPSRAVDLRDLISVENYRENDRAGIYLLTVTQQRASLLTAAYGYLHPHMDLNPVERVIPLDMDEEEHRKLLVEQMAESRHLAQVVALRRGGFDVEIISDGVEVIGFLDDAPAKDFLKENDLIIYVEDNPVYLATEVPLLVQDRNPGEEVILTFIRDEQEKVLSVPTGAHPDDENIPYLGIYIQTLYWEPVIPIEITMDTGKIGGPSAGLMFVLEIMNQVLPGDITGGNDIAGTGTIDLNENVGRVGGIAQKVIAAEKAGIDYFFIPEGNYEEAKKTAQKIELVPVSNLDEVLDFLEKIDS